MSEIQMIQVTDDIESIKAGIAAARKIADSVQAVMADGQVDFKDVKELPSLFMQVRSLVDAIKGMKPELQDLSNDELKEVLSEGLDLMLHIAKLFGMEL